MALAPLSLLRRTLRVFSDRGARFLGAAIAFYALLSAAPLFVVVLYVTGLVFGRARAESALWGGLGQWLAADGVETVRKLTERVEQSEGSSGFLGLVLVLYGSTRLFRALRRAINQIWGIDVARAERERHPVKRYALRYGTAALLALLVVVLVAVLAAVKTSFAVLATLGTQPPPFLLWTVDLVVSIALAFLLFLALFRLLPETAVTWKEATVSALVSTVLFGFGSVLVTMYVRHKDVSNVYEGASALVLVVVWVYYSAQVLFLGASVGAALHDRDRDPEAP